MSPLARGVLWLALALVVSAQTGNLVPRFLFTEGRRADTCAWGLGITIARADCLPGTEQAAPTTTVLLPSRATAGGTGHPALPGIVGAGFASIPLTGAQVAAADFADQTYLLGLTTENGLCSQPLDAARGFAVVTRAAMDVTMGGTATFPVAWFDQQLELESGTRRLCWARRTGVVGTVTAAGPGGITWFYTGWRLGVVFHCDPNNAAFNCPPAAPVFTTGQPRNLTEEELAIRAGRTTCCKSNLATLMVGQCINAGTPNGPATGVQGCCGSNAGGAAYALNTERCCNGTSGRVALIDGPCACFNDTLAGSGCPANELCCLNSKFGELNYAGLTDGQAQRGECFNPQFFRCCNTGQRYDPGSQQCCTINGPQSLNVPCPCTRNNDCWGGEQNTREFQMACCEQTAPVRTEVATEFCSTYQNFPSGLGLANAQRCFGRCYDTRYQICCNGAVCRNQFETCCNATCCNRFTGSCARTALRPGSPTGSAFNFREFMVVYDVCTTKEQLNPIRSFWIFVLPTALLAATLISLALVLVFANKAAALRFSFVEKALIFLSVLAILFAIPLFFSPVYKYGIVIVFVGLTVIVAAAARVRKLNIAVAILLFLTFLYLFDPLTGSNYFNVNSDRVPASGAPNVQSSGLPFAINRMWFPVRPNEPDTTMYCVGFYDYFMLDPNLRDTSRLQNPLVMTFGYCSRGWITALLIFAGILFALILMLLVLAILAALLRFRAKSYEPVELEVRRRDSSVSDYYDY